MKYLKKWKVTIEYIYIYYEWKQSDRRVFKKNYTLLLK